MFIQVKFCRNAPLQLGRALGINADQLTTAAQDEEEWRKAAKQGAERFMVEWIAAEKVKAGLLHAVVCPNITGRTKEGIARSNHVRVCLFAIVDNFPQVARSCILRSVRRFHVVVLWRYVCFVLFRFRLIAFIQAATLRSIVHRYK